ncbi:MAG TPA: hypothetical protein VGH47_07365 [Xanthobacteraceae bacterium]|jgi:hypothetical protein
MKHTARDKLAHTYQIFTCNDPDCGVHIQAFDAANKIICEIVMGSRQASEMSETIDNILQEKVEIDR